jgi:hypothetical protein
MAIATRILLTAIGAAHAAALTGAARRFRRAARHPRATQAALLDAFLRKNAQTAYGEAHGYAAIRGVRDFQDRVPIVDYDALAPYVERIAAGEARVLTAAPVRMLERSSGSASARKLVPYTDDLLAEFAAATGPWLRALYTQRPAILGTRSYWSVSPAARDAERTRGGLRIGFDDDTEYFGPVERAALRRMLAVPGTVARIGDLGEWRRETARCLLAAEDLGLISVWSPTFLTLLMRFIEAELPSLLASITKRRAAQIEAAIARAGAVVGEAIWPRLALVSCWTDGHARGFVPAMQRYFPRTEIQPKGLLATEGVISFPLLEAGGGGANVVALTSHFLEFIPEGDPGARPRLCDELEVGGRYSPLLTTGGGFARYHLADVVTCLGHHRGAPLVRFEGKLDRVSDVCGEKLHVAEVDRAVDAATREAGIEVDFALLAPSPGDRPRYELFVEATGGDEELEKMAQIVERELLLGHHYRYCRDLGQLGAVVAVPVTGGHARFEDAVVRRGGRAGDIKPTHLDARTFWGDVFR